MAIVEYAGKAAVYWEQQARIAREHGKDKLAEVMDLLMETARECVATDGHKHYNPLRPLPHNAGLFFYDDGPVTEFPRVVLGDDIEGDFDPEYPGAFAMKTKQGDGR